MLLLAIFALAVTFGMPYLIENSKFILHLLDFYTCCYCYLFIDSN